MDDDCFTPLANGCESTSTSKYDLYNPSTKKIDQTNRSLNNSQFTYSNIYIDSSSPNQVTLVCEGSYSGQLITPGLIWGTYSDDINDGLLKAEITLPSSFKSCTTVSNKNGLSFDCIQ